MLPPLSGKTDFAVEKKQRGGIIVISSSVKTCGFVNISMRIGPLAVLTVHQTVIHFARFAVLPLSKKTEVVCTPLWLPVIREWLED